jgi:4-phospho-D-threonate 3-dehydrogenase / 4-phospho-D-erythronate 3-dehydrogenase
MRAKPTAQKKPRTKLRTEARRASAPPLLAVSLGCPAGVGPEVAVAALAELRKRAKSSAGGVRVVFVGDPRIVAEAAQLRRLDDPIRVCASAADLAAIGPSDLAVFGPSPTIREPFEPGRPTKECGARQLEWIELAAGLVEEGLADALVTGPVSKAVVASSGGRARRFVGHTELLAERAGLEPGDVTMAFVSDELTTGLVTTHLALSAVPRAITKEAVARAARHVAALVARLRGRPVRVAITSLNPHAGEAGLFGREEARAIVPGIAAARRALARAGVEAELLGPIGAETAFRKAVRAKDFDAVVAMYHDQATIPSKVVAFGEAVNVTLGLPYVRTSVDHGTAYDVAWTGAADPAGMVAALELAARLLPA